MNTKEKWVVINGYDDYQISSFGRVKSLSRNVWNGLVFYRTKDKILKPSLTRKIKGYLKVNLYKEKKRKSRLVHQLVAEAFLNHTPNGLSLVVNHIDFNTINNKVYNLEIVTTRENCNRKHIKSSSKYTGVSWKKQTNKWGANIHINGKCKSLGYYHSEELASEAYQEALKLIKL